MKPNNLRLRCILFFHPQYHLEADNLCGVDCLKGCTTNMTVFNGKEYYHCHSDNGNDLYVAPLYAKLVSPKKTKIIRYGTESFWLADELYQQVLEGKYVPVIGKRKELVYEGANNRSYR